MSFRKKTKVEIDAMIRADLAEAGDIFLERLMAMEEEPSQKERTRMLGEIILEVSDRKRKEVL